MSDFEARIVQLERAKWRWKTLAICMCAGVCLFVAVSIARLWAEQAQAEQMLADVLHAKAAAELNRDTAKQP